MNKKYLTTENLPSFWWSLTETDKYQYNCLRLALAVSTEKNQRNQRIHSFRKCIEAVKAFAVRGDCNDKLRSYVCGIIWLPEGIAVNTHYLKPLISKCKSSINGSLQKMGYTLIANRVEAASIMASNFPNLKDYTSELRKWSIRKMPVKIDSEPKQQAEPVEENYPIVSSSSDPELFARNSLDQIQTEMTVYNQPKPIEPITVSSMPYELTEFEEPQRPHYDDWDLNDDSQEAFDSLFYYNYN